MKKFLFPVLISISTILIGILMSSIFYYFNITSDKINNILLYLISILSLFIGSFKLSNNLKYKGIINGLIFYLVFVVISLFISFIIFNIDFKLNNLVFYIVLFLFSILGGIIGKNYQTKNDVI